MIFTNVALDEAEGLILAHSTGTTSGMLRKGRTLTVEDVAALRSTGHTAVTCARLEAGDVDENAAASRIATMLSGTNVRAGKAATGRADLYAEAAGLVILDAATLIALNRIDEALTIATLKPLDRVAAGEVIATIKIIPFALPEHAIGAAADICAVVPPPVAVRPFQRKSAGLILTKLPHTKSSILTKRQRVTQERLEAIGSSLAASEVVDHDEQAVAGAIQRMVQSKLDPILIFAASATVDRRDVIPAALNRVGGEVEQIGMPAEPGNQIMVGRLGHRDVIGLPGCAGSPKLNGFDWVLERRLAGIQVRRNEITELSIGGLLR
ncbi:MAG: molybdopterin-binding protein [Hyphomicrobiaceae bacterium]